MMKRTHTYEINHLNNTVVITKAFLEAASQMNNAEFELYRRFQELGFTIVVRTRSNRKKSESPLRSLKAIEEKKPLIPFAKMAHYISLLDDADEMMDEFDAIRNTAKSQKSPRKYVNDWFRETFPQYEAVPELDENNHIIHNPNVA